MIRRDLGGSSGIRAGLPYQMEVVSCHLGYPQALVPKRQREERGQRGLAGFRFFEKFNLPSASSASSISRFTDSRNEALPRTSERSSIIACSCDIVTCLIITLSRASAVSRLIGIGCPEVSYLLFGF